MNIYGILMINHYVIFYELGYDNVYLGNFEDTIRKNNNIFPHENIISGIFKKR